MLGNFSKFSISEIISVVFYALFWLVIAAQISPNEYGEIHYLIGIAAIVSGVSIFGSGSSLVVLISKKEYIQSTITLISLIISSVGFVIAYFLINRIDVGLLIFGIIFYNLGGYILQGKQAYGKLLLYNIIQKSIFIALSEISIMFDNQQIVLALSSSQFIFLNIIIRNFRKSDVNFYLLRRKICFFASNYGTALLSIMKDNIDKIIILPILGYSVLGNYSLALQGILLLTGSITILTRYSLPLLSKGENVQKLFKFSYFTSIPMTIVGYFLLPLGIENLLPKYEHTIEAIKIISFSIPFYIIANIFQTRFIAAEKSQYVIIGNIIFFITITTGMILFGTHYGILGVAYSYLISMIIHSVFFYSLRKKI